VGISLATYLLTELSGLAAEKKFPEFRTALREGVLQMVFINALATVLLLTLAEPMIRLLFEHGKFTPAATGRATFALLCLSPGLVFFSLSNILARAFYALGDTKTPMRISLFGLGVNLVLVFLFVTPLRQGGLGLANTLSSTLNAALLLYALKRKLPKFALRELLPNLAAVAGAAVLAAFAAWGTNALWERWLGHEHLFQRLGAVFIPIAVATGVYAAVALWLKLPQARELLHLFAGRLLHRGAKPPSPPPSAPGA
jgi:putative peptidoglycan lipid II flippase